MKKVLAVLAAVLVLGVIGYSLAERMPLPDAVLSAVSVMATVGVPQGISQPGKLFTAALIIASISIAVVAVVKFFSPPVSEEEDMLTGFFGSTPQEQNLIMKELKVGSGSPLAGLQKAQALQKYGVVVVGIKRKSGFDIDAPLNMRVKAGSTALVLGTPAALLGVERRRKQR